MGSAAYPVGLVRDLRGRVEEARLHAPPRVRHYEDGDVLDLSLTAIWPERPGRGRFRVEKFVGGGFAGQVYRCVLDSLDESGGGVPGLTVGGVYGVKILVPPTRFSVRFRDALYWLGFQSAFSAQVNEAACRAGLLWQTLVRRAAAARFGRPDAVAEAYASFFDENLQSFGEVRAWVRGRPWRLEVDARPRLRRQWRTLRPEETGSPEFVAKRQFMARLVDLLHEMGARELARQYEWWTLKSQPNVLKLEGSDQDPAAGLCAFDFRAGLVLLPFLPMSPRDFGLILEGIGHGALVQFDRGDLPGLRRFVDAHRAEMGDDAPAILDALERYETGYRRSMPDLSRQGLRLLWDGKLRGDVRRGTIGSYRVRGLADPEFAALLDRCPGRFAAFYLLGAVPLAGRFLRRFWGRAAFRRHLRALLAESGYFKRFSRAGIAHALTDWLRSGRAGERRVRWMADRPVAFWSQRLTLGLLPAGLHRSLAEPAYVAERVRAGWRFMRSFYREAAFREKWLRDLVTQASEDGALDPAERDTILEHIRDPYIAKYLKALAVHFATLPISEVVVVVVATAWAIWAFLHGESRQDSWNRAGLAFAGVAAAFLASPVSPGSICRGAYVAYLMVKERHVRNYLVAAPLSCLKAIGYFAFPIQMVASYPALSRFMASRGATRLVHVVPVFGERGAWLEHAVFDFFFNRPRVFGAWVRRHARGVLNAWLAFGVAMLGLMYGVVGVAWNGKGGINLALSVLVLCILPRTVFYPVMASRAGTSRSAKTRPDR